MKLPDPHVRKGLVHPFDMQLLKEKVLLAYRAAETSDNGEIQVALKWGGLAIMPLWPWIESAIAPIVIAVREIYPEAKLIRECSVFRRIVPDRSTYIYWHMDADGTGSVVHDPVFNCWMPLEDVGIDYPSLEIIVNSEELMRRVGPNPPGHRADAWVDEMLPKKDIMCPHMKVGDALIFSHFLLHRTQPMDVLKGTRIGCEMRFSIPA